MKKILALLLFITFSFPCFAWLENCPISVKGRDKVNIKMLDKATVLQVLHKAAAQHNAEDGKGEVLALDTAKYLIQHSNGKIEKVGEVYLHLNLNKKKMNVAKFNDLYGVDAAQTALCRFFHVAFHVPDKAVPNHYEELDTYAVLQPIYDEVQIQAQPPAEPIGIPEQDDPEQYVEMLSPYVVMSPSPAEAGKPKTQPTDDDYVVGDDELIIERGQSHEPDDYDEPAEWTPFDDEDFDIEYVETDQGYVPVLMKRDPLKSHYDVPTRLLDQCSPR